MDGGLLTLTIFCVGYVAQLTYGTLGIGFGVFSASLLIFLGFYPATVSASVHVAKVFVSLISGGSHLRLGNVQRELATPLSIFGMFGGICGACLLSYISGALVRPAVAALLLLIGVRIILRFARTPRRTNNSPASRYGLSFRRASLLGFVAAFVDGVGGGGWGPIATASMMLSDVEPRKAVGSVNLAGFFVSVVISLTFLLTLGAQGFPWQVIVALLAGGALAAPLAALLCKKLPHRTLGTLVGVALVGVNMKTILPYLL
ncbi:sulfite exporter TauE/SafE family protein [Candidatus Alkanophaga liquidiphilum]|nr:Sulfite exporter TauE/SafE/YfcA [Candidatus Alkanophaga liquidiphilum]RLG38600.1 MAG: sulfite exporter TauE/SafE family protein [Candidatus Alkanophagales archaeon]